MTIPPQNRIFLLPADTDQSVEIEQLTKEYISGLARTKNIHEKDITYLSLSDLREKASMVKHNMSYYMDAMVQALEESAKSGLLVIEVPQSIFYFSDCLYLKEVREMLLKSQSCPSVSIIMTCNQHAYEDNNFETLALVPEEIQGRFEVVTYDSEKQRHVNRATHEALYGLDRHVHMRPLKIKKSGPL